MISFSELYFLPTLDHNPGSPTPIKVPEFCQATDLCVKTCKYVVKLGAKMADGCPSCACEKNELGSMYDIYNLLKYFFMNQFLVIASNEA